MESNNKRQHRELDDATKQKIANSLRGRPKSPAHSENISKALIDYWKTVPHKPREGEVDKDSTTPINENK